MDLENMRMTTFLTSMSILPCQALYSSALLAYHASSMTYKAISEKCLSPRIIGLKEVIAHTNDSKSKIHRLIHEGKFPKHANKLDGTTSAGWFENQIFAYLEALSEELLVATISR
jgi:predicted DNA-binding transcriptional regulator AlpA